MFLKRTFLINLKRSSKSPKRESPLIKRIEEIHFKKTRKSVVNLKQKKDTISREQVAQHLSSVNLVIVTMVTMLLIQ